MLGAVAATREGPPVPPSPETGPRKRGGEGGPTGPSDAPIGPAFL